MSDDLDYEQLDPGIIGLVALLRAHGFETTDSGDGVSKKAKGIDDALPYPHVFCVVDPDRLVIEAKRAWHTLNVYPEYEDLSIEASYSPDDNAAILAIYGNVVSGGSL